MRPPPAPEERVGRRRKGSQCKKVVGGVWKEEDALYSWYLLDG